jgi:hypothetical protein
VPFFIWLHCLLKFETDGRHVDGCHTKLFREPQFSKESQSRSRHVEKSISNSNTPMNVINWLCMVILILLYSSVTGIGSKSFARRINMSHAVSKCSEELAKPTVSHNIT